MVTLTFIFSLYLVGVALKGGSGNSRVILTVCLRLSDRRWRRLQEKVSPSSPWRSWSSPRWISSWRRPGSPGISPVRRSPLCVLQSPPPSCDSAPSLAEIWTAGPDWHKTPGILQTSPVREAGHHCQSLPHSSISARTWSPPTCLCFSRSLPGFQHPPGGEVRTFQPILQVGRRGDCDGRLWRLACRSEEEKLWLLWLPGNSSYFISAPFKVLLGQTSQSAHMKWTESERT